MAKKEKPSFSASHEREEGRKMKSSLIRSLLGILFGWVPLLGLILGLSGFLGACRRVTRKYKVALILLTVFTVLVLVLDVGVLTWEVYAYTRNPAIVSMTGDCLWKQLTGAEDREESLTKTVEAWKHPESIVKETGESDTEAGYEDYEFTPYGVDYDAQGGEGLGQEEEVAGVLLPANSDNTEIVPPDNAGGDTVVIEAGSEKTGIPDGLPSVGDILTGDKK